MNEYDKAAREVCTSPLVTRGSNFAGYATMAGTAVPESAIPSAMSALVKSNHALHDIISQLTQRLEPILTPQPPMPVGNESVKPPRLSLAQQIGQQSDSALSAYERLNSLLSRIEL